MLTAFRCCYKSTLLLFFFLFRFFFSFIRFMLVRDAQTRSLFMFLFVTKLTLCVWRAWLSELNRKKVFKVRVNQNDESSSFFCGYSYQCGFYIRYIAFRFQMTFSLISVLSFVCLNRLLEFKMISSKWNI